jgi:CHASE2 domain-containing sensor protein
MSEHPLASVPGVGGLEAQKALVKRARRDALHWAFRAAMLALISGLALRYGWFLFGGVFAVLALMAAGLVRSMRRRAAALAEKIRLMEGRG